MKKIITLLAAGLILSSCSSPSPGAPITPAQMPTVITMKSISSTVLMEGTLSFEADYDASDVEISITNDAACGTTTIDGINITLTTGDNWAGNNLSECNVSFTAGGIEIGNFDYQNVLSEARSQQITFEATSVTSAAAYPDIAVDDLGNIHVCYAVYEGGAYNVYYAHSDYTAANWEETLVINNAYKCIIRARNGKIGILGMGANTGEDYFRYSENNGQTFATAVELSNGNFLSDHAAVMDENGVFHLLRILFNAYTTINEVIIASCTSSCTNETVVNDDDGVFGPNGVLNELDIDWYDSKLYAVYTAYPNNEYRTIKLKEILYDNGYTVNLTSIIANDGSVNYPAVTITQDGDPVITWSTIVDDNYFLLSIAKFDLDTSTLDNVYEIDGGGRYYYDMPTAFAFESEENNYHLIYRYWDMTDLIGGFKYTVGDFASGDLILNDPVIYDFIENFNSNHINRADMSSVGRSYIIYFQPNDTFQMENWPTDFTQYDVYIGIGTLE